MRFLPLRQDTQTARLNRLRGGDAEDSVLGPGHLRDFSSSWRPHGKEERLERLALFQAIPALGVIPSELSSPGPAPALSGFFLS